VITQLFLSHFSVHQILILSFALQSTKELPFPFFLFPRSRERQQPNKSSRRLEKCNFPKNQGYLDKKEAETRHNIKMKIVPRNSWWRLAIETSEISWKLKESVEFYSFIF
jgi:hypothetical protein